MTQKQRLKYSLLDCPGCIGDDVGLSYFQNTGSSVGKTFPDHRHCRRGDRGGDQTASCVGKVEL